MNRYEELQQLAASTQNVAAMRALWELLVRQDEAIARLESRLGIELDDESGEGGSDE